MISYLKELYEGGLFAPLTCDDERRFNPAPNRFQPRERQWIYQDIRPNRGRLQQKPVRACLLCLASQLAPDLRGPLPAAGGGLAALVRGLARGVSCRRWQHGRTAAIYQRV